MPARDLPGPGEPGARLLVEGTLNFRDVGGYATMDGRRMRTGCVYRSDHLNGVTDAGLATLGSLGLRTIVDLRMQTERERQPSRLPADVDVVLAHDSAADDLAQVEMLEEIKAGRVTAVNVDDVSAMYEQMLTDATFMFATMVRTVASAERHAVVVHCTAGKDRTGLSAALVQRLCGVPDDAIARDYELTNPYRASTRFVQLSAELAPLGIDMEAIRTLIEAPLPALVSALAWIDRHGGTEAYVVDHCGVDRTTVAALRSSLIV